MKLGLRVVSKNSCIVQMHALYLGVAGGLVHDQVESLQAAIRQQFLLDLCAA